jgi:amino acid adenylation domain-containing protein
MAPDPTPSRVPVSARATGQCLHDLIAPWSAATPEALAVRCGGAELTYAGLDQASGRLASYLRQLEAGPDRIVGVLIEPGPALLTAIAAIIRAGAAYLPLDPAYPARRIAYLVGDAGCELVVTTRGLAERLQDAVLPVCPDDPLIAATLARLPAADDTPGAVARPDNLAYVIYTSGSTGAPKGTLVPHRGAVSLVRHAHDAYGIGPGDRVLQFASICFDVSVSDIFGTLANGATLVCASRATLVDPLALTMLMQAEEITVADLPPAMLPLLDPADLPRLRLLHVGGEALTHAQAVRWCTAGRTVYHRYGPTEATVCCAEHRVAAGGGTAAPPIGRALPGVRLGVVDGAGRPVADGIAGELTVGGVGVSRGYLGRPGLTAARFAPDPDGPAGGRRYLTGDLARRHPDGELEFLGRVDAQIKVSGHRIEPGEIEAALAAHPAIRLVAVDRYPAADGHALIAFIVSQPGVAAPGVPEVYRHLRGTLPPYMIPDRVRVLGELPLTANGKVDRQALRDLAAAGR